MVKIKVYVKTNMNGSECVDYLDAPDDWHQMTEEERELYLDECVQDHLGNCAEFGAFAIEDDEE